MVKELWLYYFSGTGNAKHACEWIADNARERGIAVQILDIAKIAWKDMPPPPQHAMLGFAGPTHGFNFPPLMLKFIHQFPSGVQNIFILNTRGGLKFGKLFIPGVSGLAQFYTALIMKIKGYHIIGMQPVDLPSNWISLHPALHEPAVIAIHKRWKDKLAQFCYKIFNGEKVYRAFFDIIQDLLVSPIAIAYFFIGRFFLAKSFIAGGTCNACGVCVQECPVQALIWVNNRPFWTHHCESCMHCMNICPQRAVQTAHGYVIGSMLIFYNLFTWLIFKHFFQPVHGIFANHFVQFIIISIVIFPIFLVTYRLLYSLLTFTFFEKLFTRTCLTFYKFWGRYKISKQTWAQINQEEE